MSSVITSEATGRLRVRRRSLHGSGVDGAAYGRATDAGAGDVYAARVVRMQSSHGVGSIPKVAVVSDVSITNGRSNWCDTSPNARAMGTTRPAARSSERGMVPTLGVGTPATAAIEATASRWVNGAFDGTSHALPHDRSSVPSVASVRATSGTKVHECGASAEPNTHTFFPAST